MPKKTTTKKSRKCCGTCASYNRDVGDCFNETISHPCAVPVVDVLTFPISVQKALGFRKVLPKVWMQEHEGQTCPCYLEANAKY